MATALTLMTAVDDATAAPAHERAWIEAAIAGDGLAFRRLVEPHLGMLHRIAWRACGNDALAEDAVQEALTLAYERLRDYRHETSFRAFIAAVAAKRAHTLIRSKRRRQKREDAAMSPQHLPTPEEALRGAHAVGRVRDALAAMPKKRREAALLRLDAGLSYREIAEALNSSEGSARVLVHQALKELRERLADLLETAP